MTKTLDTLIQDIYSTLEKGVDVSQPSVQEALDEVGSLVREATETVLREGERTGASNLRLSQIGKPDRQIWYGVQGEDGEPLNGQTRIKFLMGHVLEALLICLTKVSGHTVEEAQDTVEVEGVLGHQDCVIDGVLTDIKSASAFGFKKFKENRLADDDPFGYIAQISAYATKNNRDEAAFLAIDKNSGELAVTRVHELEMIDAPARVRHLKGMVQSETAPSRCYNDTKDGESGNRKLAIGCVFCPYKKKCWADANGGAGLRAFKYSNGVRYMTQVAKTPNVEELEI
tara:strand:+ start:162 stop:1019 length:858 start_codon:yes stop_codon:yes gene_type:complete